MDVTSERVTCMPQGTISRTRTNFLWLYVRASMESKPIKLSSGNERKFLADGDTCTMSGYAKRMGFALVLDRAHLPCSPQDLNLMRYVMTNVISYNPYDLPLRDRHRLLTGAIGPRPICWASTLSKEGDANLAPIVFSICLAQIHQSSSISNRRSRDNTTKDTYHNLLDNGEVVVNIVSYDLVHQMNISSTDYAEDVNEFSKAGVTPNRL